jgi:hypothetical protein
MNTVWVPPGTSSPSPNALSDAQFSTIFTIELIKPVKTTNAIILTPIMAASIARIIRFYRTKKKIEPRGKSAALTVIENYRRKRITPSGIS